MEEPGEELLQFVVGPEEDGLNLAGLLRSRYGMSRGMIRRLKREPCVFADGVAVPMRHRLRTGERIVVRVPSGLESSVVPEPVPLRVLFEDRDILVLDKPAGVLVHPARSEQSGTLANGVAYHLVTRGEPNAAGPVTRLDRDTSGLVLFAKHPHAHHCLSRGLAAGTLGRRYIAVVHGHLAHDSGAIDLPIARLNERSSVRVVAPGGQRALTHFRVVARIGPTPSLPQGATLVELSLETGRTHQIRVHLAHLGHPLVGDRLYGRAVLGDEELLLRQALHAYRLELCHPANGERLRFLSPPPDDLRKLVGLFGEAASGLWDVPP